MCLGLLSLRKNWLCFPKSLYVSFALATAFSSAGKLALFRKVHNSRGSGWLGAGVLAQALYPGFSPWAGRLKACPTLFERT